MIAEDYAMDEEEVQETEVKDFNTDAELAKTVEQLREVESSAPDLSEEQKEELETFSNGITDNLSNPIKITPLSPEALEQTELKIESSQEVGNKKFEKLIERYRDIENIKKFYLEAEAKLMNLANPSKWEIRHPSNPLRELEYTEFLKEERDKYFGKHWFKPVAQEMLDFMPQLMTHLEEINTALNTYREWYLQLSELQSAEIIKLRAEKEQLQAAYQFKLGDIRARVEKLEREKIKEDFIKQQETFIDKQVEKEGKTQTNLLSAMSAKWEDFVDVGVTEESWHAYKVKVTDIIERHLKSAARAMIMVFNNFKRDVSNSEWNRSAFMQVLLTNQQALVAKHGQPHFDNILKKFAEMEFPG